MCDLISQLVKLPEILLNPAATAPAPCQIGKNITHPHSIEKASNILIAGVAPTAERPAKSLFGFIAIDFEILNTCFEENILDEALQKRRKHYDAAAVERGAHPVTVNNVWRALIAPVLILANLDQFMNIMEIERCHSGLQSAISS